MGIAMSVVRHNDFFFGWRVVGAAFVLAVLALGNRLLRPANLLAGASRE
jgi:hypothetical protein